MLETTCPRQKYENYMNIYMELYEYYNCIYGMFYSKFGLAKGKQFISLNLFILAWLWSKFSELI